MKKQKFKVLDTGNFYFPMPLKGKKFIVEDTIDVYSKNKMVLEKFKLYGGLLSIKDHYTLTYLGNICWEIIKLNKLDKEYKDYYLVPQKLDKLGKEICLTVDILKPIK